MQEIEAMADAIMNFEGWHRGSRSWRNRNPGNLEGRGTMYFTDMAGYRIFESLDLGWKALLDDLQAKFDGSHGLTPASTLLDLFSIYAPSKDGNSPGAYAQFVAAWVSSVLGRHITPFTTLSEYLNPPKIEK